MLTLKLKCKELYHKLFDGELTLDKSTLWLIGAVIFMMGVLYGLLKAPLTHGINITCGNGSNNHDNTGNGLTLDEEDD